jgi:NitT/TauT family transport system substrate-binding protein
MVLNGTTGFGMANLMDAAARGEARNDYTFSVETDASNIVAALANGSADIAALPTNAAATVYNKTQGKVQVLALNTLGVLYLVTDGSVTVESMADLAGKTVYAPAQNPSFIFQHICQANGLTDVTIDNTYAQPADLNAAVAAGEVSIAVLPEPMVTVAKSKNPNLQVALDLTAEWDKVSPAGSLVQGCVVVRTAFAQENPGAVAAFLEEYGASIEGLTADIEGTAAKIEALGIFTKAAVAAKAIPNCNVCFIVGTEMQAALSEFLNIMFSVAPASVGGAVPAEDFYCILQ